AVNQLAIYSKSVLSRSQNAFQIDNGSQVLTTVSLLLHNGFTRPVFVAVSQLYWHTGKMRIFRIFFGSATA
ncbi:MAG: hypothetical protein KBH52_05935, partial [Synergistaceae bacterium]|nr:hypothetical protein [Synergistaceae bacterium]